MKIEVGRLQEAILEIVEVEEHTVLIKGRLRVTVLPVKSTGSTHLDIGQLTYRTLEQFLFPLVITSSSLSSTAESIIKRYLSEVILQIAQFIVTGSKYTGYG